MSDTSDKGSGADERRPDLPPTQGHILVSAVQDRVAVIRLAVNRIPVTTLAAVLEVGALDITRLGETERRAFIARYTETLRTWRFPFQIVVGRRRQQLDEFKDRAAQHLRRWQQSRQARRAALLGELLDFVDRVTLYANPQLPCYHLALPYAVPTAAAQAGRVNQAQYRDALQLLDDRCRNVQQGLAGLAIGARRLDDGELVDLLYAFYHPSLPVLWLSPRDRIASLVATGETQATAGSEDLQRGDAACRPG
jgi:hypothetical protein